MNKTGSEINHAFLFHGVIKILTACRMPKISIARCQIEPKIHSFPTMYIMGGVNMFEMGQIGDFVKKIALKSCFFTDTNHIRTGTSVQFGLLSLDKIYKKEKSLWCEDDSKGTFASNRAFSFDRDSS